MSSSTGGFIDGFQQFHLYESDQGTATLTTKAATAQEYIHGK